MRTSDGDNGVSDVGEQPRRDHAARGGPGAGRRIFPRLRPVVLGEGVPLVGRGRSLPPLELVSTRQLPGGVLLNRYLRA